MTDSKTAPERLVVSKCRHILTGLTCYEAIGQLKTETVTRYATGWGATSAEAVARLQERLSQPLGSYVRTCWEQPDEWWARIRRLTRIEASA